MIIKIGLKAYDGVVLLPKSYKLQCMSRPNKVYREEIQGRDKEVAS